MEKKRAGLKKQTEKMNQEFDQFSVTLNKKHLDNALAIRDQIVKDGFEAPPVKFSAVEVYKKSFTFPQIANNDYAVEQLETLSVAEQNLTSDANNSEVLDQFIKTADEVAHNLIERYHEQWVDPKDDRN